MNELYELAKQIDVIIIFYIFMGAGIYGIAGLQSGVADRAWDPAGGGSHTCKYSEYSGTGCNQLSDHEILGNARKKKS